MAKSLPQLPGRAVGERAGRASMFDRLAASGRLRTVPLDAIEPNPRQPRKRFSEDALRALSASLDSRGLLQPAVVREVGDDRYMLVAGERRWRAARLAGWESMEVLVKDTDDDGALADAIAENTARVDLSPIEAARGYVTMVEDLHLTRDEVGKRTGQSRASVSNHIRLLDLPDEAIEAIDTGALSFAHGRALLLTKDHGRRRALARQAIAEGLTSRQLEGAAKAPLGKRAERAPQEGAADQEAAAGELADALREASGLDLTVRARAGGRFVFTVEGVDAARALVAGWRAPARRSARNA